MRICSILETRTQGLKRESSNDENRPILNANIIVAEFRVGVFADTIGRLSLYRLLPYMPFLERLRPRAVLSQQTHEL